MNKKILVAYFSATGTTKKAAQALAEAAHADIYEIKPEVPYTKDDLNWTDRKSRSSVEMSDQTYRPAIADQSAEIENYDLIFLGYPVWWYVAPTIVNTFLESYDFGGKTIVLFATSGGSGFGKAAEKLKSSCADAAVIKEGKILNGKHSKEELAAWVEKVRNQAAVRTRRTTFHVFEYSVWNESYDKTDHRNRDRHRQVYPFCSDFYFHMRYPVSLQRLLQSFRPLRLR